MCSSIHLLDLTGLIFQPLEQVERISTTEVPRPASEFSKARLRAFFARATVAGVWTDWRVAGHVAGGWGWRGGVLWGGSVGAYRGAWGGGGGFFASVGGGGRRAAG